MRSHITLHMWYGCGGWWWCHMDVTANHETRRRMCANEFYIVSLPAMITYSEAITQQAGGGWAMSMWVRVCVLLLTADLKTHRARCICGVWTVVYVCCKSPAIVIKQRMHGSIFAGLIYTKIREDSKFWSNVSIIVANEGGLPHHRF